MVGPLVVLAHQAAQEWPAGLLPPDADVRPHPHIGLVAMTYMLRGHITHRDSLGVRSEIGAGGINCLIAGRGAGRSTVPALAMTSSAPATCSASDSDRLSNQALNSGSGAISNMLGVFTRKHMPSRAW